MNLAIGPFGILIDEADPECLKAMIEAVREYGSKV
jgi:hypothetical protein